VINNEWASGLDALEYAPEAGSVGSVEEAVTLVEEALESTAHKLPGPDVVLLSGGVDSILTAVAAVRAGHAPLLVTVTAVGVGSGSDGVRAQRAAAHLGLEWVEVPISADTIGALVDVAIADLGVRGIYQVGAAVANEAMATVLGNSGASWAWSGNGADILFGPYPDPNNPDGPLRLDWGGRRDLVRRACSLDAGDGGLAYDAAFTRIGLRTLGFFESEECLRVAARLAPRVLSTHVVGTEHWVVTHKAPLRVLARRWGVPEELCFTEHHSLQESSGIFDLMAELARASEAEICDDFTVHARRRHSDAKTLTAYWLQLR
jgi:asparagine synthetase B (glutamine-hydrolysing)